MTQAQMWKAELALAEALVELEAVTMEHQHLSQLVALYSGAQVEEPAEVEGGSLVLLAESPVADVDMQGVAGV